MSELILSYFNDLWSSVYETSANPRKRVYWGYLLLALATAVVWLKWKRGQSFAQGVKSVLSRDIWLSPSAIGDYKVLLINKAILLLVVPLFITKLALATWLFQMLFRHVGAPPGNDWLPSWAIPIAFTVFLFLLDDFARYYLHLLMHRIPALWAFHQVHHSARVMTPFTVLRTHPVESFLFTLRSVLVQGISIGLFIYLFGNQVDLVTVLGVNIFVFMFNVAGSNLRHSHVPINYWPWLERWLISPAQHQIHHSQLTRHYDRNFGAVLAVWDRLGGSLHPSEPDTELTFGVTKVPKADEQHLKTLYLKPFAMAYRALLPKRFKRHRVEKRSLS